MPRYNLGLPKRKQKKLIVGVILIILGLFASKFSGNIEQTTGIPINNNYQVTQVFDGDTIEVNVDGKKEKIRFIGVDTPETHDPRKAVQCFGKSASNFTSSKLLNKQVRLESDSLSTNRDRYSRLLRYVYLTDGSLINSKIIEEGYGFAYTAFDFQKSNEFKALQDQARSQKRGLWSSCSPYTNQYGGFTSNDE